MSVLPIVLVSSVIRSSQQGESHGGVYLLNLESGEHRQVIDWDAPDISWEGRGWDRGLRGIAFYNDHIYLAASDEIFVYDQQFNIIESFRNAYLRHCHEIRIKGHHLYITSTGYDSVLIFDLQSKQFIQGLCIQQQEGDAVTLRRYDPGSSDGPDEAISCHINNVWLEDGTVYVSGLRMNGLYVIDGMNIQRYAPLPLLTHNAQPYRGGILCQDSASDRLAIYDLQGQIKEVFPLVRYPENELTWAHLGDDRAREAFGRGLCLGQDEMFIAGSSPSTITAYQPGNQEPVASVQLSNDIRNAVHGLEIWPYSWPI